MKKYIILWMMVIFISPTVFANGPQCLTKVNTTRVTNTGGLYVSAASMGNAQYILLCSVSNAVNGVAVDTCKSWLSILQTAQAADRNVSISYKYAPTISSCAAVPVANPPAPYFVQLVG